MIKLVALDLDGTLLDSDKKLSNRNREALQRCMDQGVHIVPATGRTLDGIPDTLKEMSGIRYAITTNGAQIEDIKEHHIIAEAKMDRGLVLSIMDIVHKYPVMYDAYIDGRGKSETRFMEHLEHYALTPQIQTLVWRTRDIVPDIRQYVAGCGQQVEKVNLFFENTDIRAQVRELLEPIAGITITSSMWNNLEINAENATKGNGIMRLAEYLQLSKQEIMSCGDGENDLSMLQAAGIGVAMANAEEVILKNADYVTLSNDEDGVAAAIERFVF